MSDINWDKIDRMEAEIERLRDDRADMALMIERLTAALTRIGRMSAPGARTLDDFIRDMGWINDETRRVLGRNE